MDFILKLNSNNFPMLNNLKSEEIDNYLLKIFKTGYQIHFPSNDKIERQFEYNELIERIDSIKDDIHNSDISTKINSLETSLSKLIGLSSNSCKKGNFGENVLEEILCI